ncbi:MAG: Holliday junction ATP-dependent DNA helicase RuvA, partial [Thermoleophilia bacterium]
MIRSVRGRVLVHEPEGPVIEVGGVGMLVRVSATTAQALPAVGAEASLLTVLVVREESLDLYGFATGEERALFEAFTSVNGVGPRL